MANLLVRGEINTEIYIYIYIYMYTMCSVAARKHLPILAINDVVISYFGGGCAQDLLMCMPSALVQCIEILYCERTIMHPK